MILSLSWKNVWRNKVRSMVVIIAVMLGIFGGVMALGIMQGWIEQRIKSSIENEISHVQINNPDFVNNEELQLTVRNPEKVVNTLDTVPEVVAFSKRTKLFAMAQSDWGSSGLVVRGIDPEREKKVTKIHENIVEGAYFEKDYRMPSIVIGAKAAENLKLKNWQITQERLDSLNPEIVPEEIIGKMAGVDSKRFRKEKDFMAALADTLTHKEMRKYGDQLANHFSYFRLRSKIRLTIVDTLGNMHTPVFRVRGIYKTGNSTYEGLIAFVDRQKLNEYTLMTENQVHEVSIISSSNSAGHELSKKLKNYFPGNSVMSWKNISPELAMFTDFGRIFNYIYVGIILFALAFGIINTMLMSVLERVKELGMLMAIGMNKRKVFRMIMLESVFLTLSGAMVGMVFSGMLLRLLETTGINFSSWSEGFEALGYATIVYPIVTFGNFIGITILVIITGVISSIWPARKALRLNPCEALRTD